MTKLTKEEREEVIAISKVWARRFPNDPGRMTKYEEALQAVEAERDAALALLREAREQLQNYLVLWEIIYGGSDLGAAKTVAKIDEVLNDPQ